MTMSKQAKADKEKAKLAKLKAEELAKEKAKQAEIEAIEQLNLQVGATVGEILEPTPDGITDVLESVETVDAIEKAEANFYISDHAMKVNGIFYNTGEKIPKA